MPTETREILLGQTGDDELVAVSLRLNPAQTGFLTVEHEPMPTDALKLGIAGSVWEPGKTRRSEPSSFGQIVDDAARVVPSEKWSREDLDRLVGIWRRWHLNGMRGGCAHMTLPADTSYDARKDVRCPTTGYKYGSAWLYEPLPQDVVDDVRRFQRRLGYPGY